MVNAFKDYPLASALATIPFAGVLIGVLFVVIG